MIVPLHVRSHHSWCAGTASPEELVARAAGYGLQALALTDLDNLCGQPRFQAACRAAGIAPILGVELRAGSSARVVLLVRNARGYANLCRIVSRRRGGWEVVEAIAGETGGLFVMTDDPGLLQRLLECGVARGDLRLLLVRPSARDERAVRLASDRWGVPLVADTEIALLDAEDRTFHALLIAALSNRSIRVGRELAAESADRWFRTPEQQQALFADVPEAVAETVRIAEQCRFALVRGRPIVPSAEAFGGRAPELALRERCQHALLEARALGRCIAADYADRLARELDVIGELGYAGYFLAAAEIAGAAAQRDIAVAVRGSAASSLVVHLLGISAIDPLAHGLLFERFLHSQREHPPDIDLDVCSDRREELLRWVFRRFGRERVALVGTLPTFQFDSALRSGLAALGASPRVRERFLAAVARLGVTTENASKQVPEAALTLLPGPLREGLELIARLIGKPRALAMHPGGIVIADRSIAELVPVELGRTGLPVAQYDRRSIEQTGLTKLDLLGNRFLAQLQRTRALSRDAPRLHECPPDDPATLARLDRADTLGCFQVETPLLRGLLTQVPIRTLEDCVAALALVRPGAAAGAAKREWLRFVHGESGARPVLFDEDLLEMLSAGAGIDLAAADVLRVRIIECDDPRELDRLGREYVQRAADNHRAPVGAHATWQQALQFAAYSFCKAHAWGYALLAYQSVYFKTHYLLEYGCALLDSYGGAYPLRTIAADLQRSGASLVVPSVNRSALASTIEDRTIVLGLERIKHLRKRTAIAILEARKQRGPFRTLEQLTTHARPSQQELRALLLSGACDSLEGLSADAYPFAHEAVLHGSIMRAVPRPDADPQRLDDFRALVRARNELELLDMHVTQHPLRILRAEARRHGCIPLTDAQLLPPGTCIRFVGLLAASRRHRARNGGVIEYLAFEDESGLLDAFVPMHAHARLGPVVTTPGPYLAEGRLLDDHGHREVELGSLQPFYKRDRAQG